MKFARALESVGLIVNRLIRISFGPFQLSDLKPGATEEEVRRRVMRDQLGLDTKESNDGTATKKKESYQRAAQDNSKTYSRNEQSKKTSLHTKRNCSKTNL